MLSVCTSDALITKTIYSEETVEVICLEEVDSHTATGLLALCCHELHFYLNQVK